ncbi:ABC transporter permease [Robertmurraya sp. DFI.2.37]|uniref:ABC transporter permease n=1 Tax=Robertmurraya sp. DFI.2.37 TaxID=3031819 RepID=UPI000BA7A592|nr:ABC transporter permease [Robertmurraya sp. DFI.2.37]MDF1510099.1 ABC transporter permease [Robertmurraya sp. DFI.2.37]PAE20104.1 peptide ABC transporter permease [Bacillus sp. 7504-2]
MNTVQEIEEARDLQYRKSKKEQSFIRKLLRNRFAALGLFVILLLTATAIFAPYFATHDPYEMDVTKTLLGPGEEGHILGTDSYGRDIYSRIVYGARISLLVGVAAVLFGAVLGSLLGLVSGYFGGRTDAIIMRIIDGMMAFPFILLAIVLMTVLGQGLVNVIIAIGISNIPGFARVVRGQVLTVKESEFIEVTRSLGAKHGRILFKHVVPNSVAPLIVYATMSVAGAIISEASLSFLGLGVQPPTASWGSMLQEGKNFLVLSPELATFSGLVILITVLGINLFGDGLRDALDPKMKL